MVNKKVFISYSHSDTDLVKVYIDQIEKMGFTPVYDNRDMHAGSILDEIIKAKIDESSIVILFLSDRSIISKWVSLEAKYIADNYECNFLNKDRDKPLKGHIVVRLDLDGIKDYNKNRDFFDITNEQRQYIRTFYDAFKHETLDILDSSPTKYKELENALNKIHNDLVEVENSAKRKLGGVSNKPSISQNCPIEAIKKPENVRPSQTKQLTENEVKKLIMKAEDVWAENDDEDEARSLFLKAIESGFLFAYIEYANFLRSDLDNEEESIEYYKIAASLGDSNSMLALYEIYKDRGEEEEANDWLLKAQLKGNSEALYQDYLNSNPNDPNAKKYLMRSIAVEEPFDDALEDAIQLYNDKKLNNKEISILYKAVMDGCRTNFAAFDCFKTLARMYFYGHGVEKSITKWFICILLSINYKYRKEDILTNLKQYSSIQKMILAGEFKSIKDKEPIDLQNAIANIVDTILIKGIDAEMPTTLIRFRNLYEIQLIMALFAFYGILCPQNITVAKPLFERFRDKGSFICSRILYRYNSLFYEKGSIEEEKAHQKYLELSKTESFF